MGDEKQVKSLESKMAVHTHTHTTLNNNVVVFHVQNNKIKSKVMHR